MAAILNLINPNYKQEAVVKFLREAADKIGALSPEQFKMLESNPNIASRVEIVKNLVQQTIMDSSSILSSGSSIQKF
jgi:hypothetical protein